MFRSEFTHVHVRRITLAISAVMFLALEVRCTLASTVNVTHTTAFMSPSPVFESKRVTTDGLLPEPTLILDYHNGPVMTGRDDTVKLFVVYYGGFSAKQKSILSLFLQSFSQSEARNEKQPTISKWWQITHLYVDLFNHGVARNLVLAGETEDQYSLGKDIKQLDLQKLVLKSVEKFGTDSRSIYIVLTSQDVIVERFCMNVCGTHFYTFPSDATQSQMLPYGWVGNPAEQCPGLCSWPYAPGGLQREGLIPPNGDVGIDGMIITVGNLLAAVATDPFGNAYFQAESYLEAGGVCQGIYGKGSFIGYPGELLVDKSTNASFNVYGSENSKFLLPYIWHPKTLQCAGQV